MASEPNHPVTPFPGQAAGPLPDGALDDRLLLECFVATREAAALIDQLVNRYRAAGLVDDAAYAAARARRGIGRGQSPPRITAALAAKGIDTQTAAEAIAGLRDNTADPELAAAAAFARRRRVGPFAPGSAASGSPAKHLAAFARAGFSRRVAELVLGCADETELAAALAATSER